MTLGLLLVVFGVSRGGDSGWGDIVTVVSMPAILPHGIPTGVLVAAHRGQLGAAAISRNPANAIALLVVMAVSSAGAAGRIGRRGGGRCRDCEERRWSRRCVS